MTQGAGQGPEVMRTATLRDFRVPAYVHETGPYAQNTPQGEGAGPVGQSGLYPSGEAPPYAVMDSTEDFPGELPGEFPEGYTPTQRDLPVINRGDTVQVSVDPAAAPAPEEGPGPLYVVGDVHGYLDQLVAALQEQGLLDA
ncbi:serine/threonine protein phosphatase, partial [Streptomyces anthocyanicus]